MSPGAGVAAPEQNPASPVSSADLSAARTEVATWDDARLAGQVIVGRYNGTDAKTPADLVRRLHLAGVCVTGGNIASAAQVTAMNAAVHAAVRADGRDIPAVIGVDQEGGTTAHLGSNATGLPTFLSAGAAVAGDSASDSSGAKAVEQATRATALELRHLGFTWVFAPVADVTIGLKDPTIGTRSPSDDAAIASAATVSAIQGFTGGGIVSTAKHYPGHGSVTADSHKALPVQNATLEQLRARDIAPFAAAAKAGAPAVMMSHIAVTAFEKGVPASLSKAAYQSLRDDAGFDGLVITDSLGMGAVRRGGDPGVRALAAGADLLLMPADTAATHAAIVKALSTGALPRERVAEAAAKVVALQRWQAHQATSQPVPKDVMKAAAAASKALSAAAITRLSTACPTKPASVVRSVTLVGGTTQERQRFSDAAKAAGLRVGSGPTVSLTGSGAQINVSLRWPRPAASGSGATSYALYGDTTGAFAALVDVLLGKASARGTLPVSVPGTRSC